MLLHTGEQIILGDWVWWNEGTNVGRVSEFVQSSSDMKRWGLKESGFFVCNDLSSQTLTQDVFTPIDLFESEGIGKIAPETVALIKNLHDQLCQQEAIDPATPYAVMAHFPHKGFSWVFVVNPSRGRRERCFGVALDNSRFISVKRNELFLE